MRKLLLVVVLLLSSCIQVDDIGSYWDKGTVDPVIEGSWFTSDKQAAFKMVKKDGHYLYEAPGTRPDQAAVQVRSIKSKQYAYLLMRTKDTLKRDVTALVRYKPDGENMIISEPDNKKLIEWAAQQKQESLFKAGGGKQLVFVSIPQLNEQALSVLDSMPDNELYWKSAILRKLK